MGWIVSRSWKGTPGGPGVGKGREAGVILGDGVL